MTNQELKNQIGEMIQQERKAVMGLLPLLREAEARRVYQEDGYTSLFDWLVKFHGYSSSAAYRRIAAARALRALPDAENKILSGRVNLTTLAQVQTTLQKEEKRLGKNISLESKTELLSRIEGKSSEETQKILVQRFPESVSRQDGLRVVGEDETKLTVILDEATLKVLKEAKDLLSHSLPNASWAEVIAVLAGKFVSEKKSVSRKIVSGLNLSAEQVKSKPQIKSRQVTAAPVSLRTKRKLVFQRAKYRCEFTDPKSSKRCESTFQLELDHLRPKSLGGSNEFGNLRCLCRQHNLLMAQKNLGENKMQKYRRRF